MGSESLSNPADSSSVFIIYETWSVLDYDSDCDYDPSSSDSASSIDPDCEPFSSVPDSSSPDCYWLSSIDYSVDIYLILY